MQLGYVRISKTDGSQSFDLQKDALLLAGVLPENIYEDQASGTTDNRTGLLSALPYFLGCGNQSTYGL